MIGFYYYLFYVSFSHFSFFQSKGGFTPLYIAAEFGLEYIVQLLLRKGANVDLSTEVFLVIFILFLSYFLFLFISPFFFTKRME